MIILIDLDGTLTDTAHEKFKPYKDGKQQTVLSDIPLIQGAKEFIADIQAKGHKAIIISDSHPSYVNLIAKEIFQIPAVSLTDKPNVEKTLNFIQSNQELKELFSNKDNFIMVGDSWLDIELGRRLNVTTVLTQFYKATSIEERDGIGQDWKPIKMGATYYAKSFEDIARIIENPIKELLSLEAIFQNENSDNMVRFLYRNYNGNFTAFRCLARQDDGECDRFARADKYTQIDNPARSKEFISTLAQAVSNYLSRVEKFPKYQWDYLTYVSDKKTTSPPNKMKEIFELINSKFNKVKIFEWSEDVEGSLRKEPDYKTRRAYISKYLKTIEGIDLNGKSVIVIDDQFTSSATANEISLQLRNKGVKNILFVALFYLILPVHIRICPKCGQKMRISLRKSDGNKFYNCATPQYRGTGCGYKENIPILQQIPVETTTGNSSDLLYKKIIVGNYYFNIIHNLSNCYGYFIWKERMHITEDFIDGFNEDVLGDTLGLVQKDILPNEIFDNIEILDLYNLNISNLEPLYVCTKVKYINLADNDILPPANFVLNFPHLDEVRLSYCKNLSENYINSIKQLKPNIKIDVSKIP